MQGEGLGNIVRWRVVERVMPSARIRFQLPGGPTSVSAANPDVEFRILATRPTADGLRVVLEAQTAETDAILSYLDEAQWLPTYHVLHRDEQTLLIEYALQSLPSLYRAILSSGHLLQFPLTLENGWLTSDLITSHEQLSKLKDAFEDEGIPYEISSIVQSTESTDLLTDRQRQVLIEAAKRGYYDTPRQCTLTELATAIGVNKSAVSGILHRAECRIIKTFLGYSGL